MNELSDPLSLLAAVREGAGRGPVRAGPPEAAEMRLLEARSLRGVPFLRKREVPAAVQRDRAIWSHQRAALRELLAEADRRGLPVYTYKGAELCERYFRSVPLCSKGDVDLLIPPEAEAQVRSLLHELGYVQADFDTNTCELVPCTPEVLARHEKGNYSLKSFVRIEELDWPGRSTAPLGYSRPTMNVPARCQLLMTVDIATGLDAAIDCRPLFARSIPSALGAGRTLCPEDHYWYLCSLFYLKMFQFKAQAKLAQMCEIGALLANEHEQLDWDLVAGAAKRYDLFAALYYLTAFLAELERLPLDPAVLAKLDPRQGSRSRDFGWQVPKVLGLLDPFPRILVPSPNGELAQ